MKNGTYVEKLYKKENELIKICKYHGLNDYDTKDIIQDLYIKLLLLKDINRYVKDDEPNMYIIFMILRNLIFDLYKKNKKFLDEDVIDYLELPETLSENEKYDFIIEEIENIVYWFDRNIVKLYVIENKTLRIIEKETTISYSTLQRVILKFKQDCFNNYMLRLKIPE